MSIETDWYVYRGQQRWGPFTWQQLVEMTQGGQIQPSDQLWHPQYPNKVRADQMQELYKSNAPAPQNAAVQGNPSQQQSPRIPDRMATTAFELPGYHITQSFGVVQALVVIAAGYGTSIAVAFSGTKGALTGPSQQALAEAYTAILQSAAQLGANAIIGLRFSADQSGYLAYGTAVWVEPD